MIVVFRGLGWMAVVLPSAGLLVAMLVPRGQQDLIAAASFVVTACVVGLVGYQRNRATQGHHTFFFVRMEYWAPILCLAGALWFWVQPMGRGWMPRISYFTNSSMLTSSRY